MKTAYEYWGAGFYIDDEDFTPHSGCPCDSDITCTEVCEEQ